MLRKHPRLDREYQVLETVLADSVISQELIQLLHMTRCHVKYKKSILKGYFDHDKLLVYFPKFTYEMKKEAYLVEGVSTSRCFHLMIIIHEMIHLQQRYVQFTKKEKKVYLGRILALMKSVRWEDVRVPENIFLDTAVSLKDYIDERLQYSMDLDEFFPVVHEVFFLINYFGVKKEHPLYTCLAEIIRSFLNQRMEVR